MAVACLGPLITFPLSITSKTRKLGERFQNIVIILKSGIENDVGWPTLALIAS